MFELLLHDLEKLKVNLDKSQTNAANQLVVSIIGAGGKSTLMYAIADAFASKYRTIVTTTTHIFKPQDKDNTYVIEMGELSKRWENQQYGVVGREEKNGKLRALEIRELQGFQEHAEVILVEADGAKRMPCKVSNTTEPVFLKETNAIVMVLGLDALGKRMRDVCFRLELAMDLLGEDRDHVMEEEDFILIIKHQMEEQLEELWNNHVELDTVPFYVVLNKCDNKKRRKQGEYIKRILEKEEKYNVYLTTFA